MDSRGALRKLPLALIAVGAGIKLSVALIAGSAAVACMPGAHTPSTVLVQGGVPVTTEKVAALRGQEA